MISWEDRFIKILILLGAVVTFGVAGFMLIEGWGFLDALYMTVLTISTVGYREVQPLSPVGTVFDIILIVFGVSAFLYIISSIGEYIVAGHLAGALGRRKMKKSIDTLKDHYIVCGYGRVGRQVARELKGEGVDFVVIDNSPDAIKLCKADELLYIEGNAAEDEVLKEAGIERAKGLVTATDSDADNVYVTLSAKSIRNDLLVVARSVSTDTEHKLLRAGADRVSSPYSIGGSRLASLLLRPTVIEFLDVVMHSSDVELFMEEITVREGSSLLGKTLAEGRGKCSGGVNILAVKKRGEKKKMARHSGETLIENWDRLVALGTKGQLKELEELSEGSGN